jgi:hypothetical protein
MHPDGPPISATKPKGGVVIGWEPASNYRPPEINRTCIGCSNLKLQITANLDRQGAASAVSSFPLG